MTTLMLIDGNSLTYRAFFALPTDMATASGQVTNAVFGFTSMITNLVRDHKPDQIAVTFDRPEPTFRKKKLDSYKANRDATPDILVQQMGLVRQVVETLNLPIVELAGVEADDIIATLATEAAQKQINCIIVTGDRDSYQLVSDPYISVLYNKRGVSDYAMYDEAGILERTGVTPEMYVEYAALRGDPSDNLPGVPGVGEKTAAKLITKWGGLDGIFANVAENTPKLRQNLEENEHLARLNLDMMTLVRDVELSVGVDDLVIGPFEEDAVVELFKFLEFGSLLGRVGEAFGAGGESLESQQRVIEAEVTVIEPSEVDALASTLSARSGPLALAASWEGAEGRSPLLGLAVVTDEETAEVAWIPAGLLTAHKATFVEVLSHEAGIVAHDAKPIMRSLVGLGYPYPKIAADTKLAAYLIDPADSRYDLSSLLGRYCESELASDGAEEGQLDFGGDRAELFAEPARRALGAAILSPALVAALTEQGLIDLFVDLELPLVTVLAEMEHLGVGVDRGALVALNDKLSTECDRLRGEIIREAGEDFNVNSTKQLRAILFDKLGLTTQKKTKTGYSTDAASLEKIRDDHPIVEFLLSYREVEKLRSTYAVGLLAEVADDGRIHATFNQTVARTGRLSSDAPNLHNIPVRSEEGRQFRSVFVPAEGFGLLVADYNQIELRCIAHLAQDPGLISAFVNNEDIHNTTAARVFGVDSADVTTEQRSKAKMVSYGLAYGMEAYGLAQRLNIRPKEAQVILDAYFEAFPSVKAYMDRTVEEARERGYTETLFGRRRRIPELASGVRSVRMAGERQAMNAGIQGLAADIFKVALVRLAAELERFESRLILQVHDEVICEVTPEEQEEVTKVVTDVMRNAYDMSIPLEVHLAFGDTWAAAKG